MKRLSVIATLILLAIACEMPKKQPARELTQQESFNVFMKTWENDYYKMNSNDLQRKEFVNAYKDSLAAYIDSIGPLIDWTGIVKEIKLKEFQYGSQRGYANLTFVIDCSIQEHQTLTFECEHLFKPAEKQTDYLYQKIYKLQDFGAVKFDGMVGLRADRSIDWYMEDIFSQPIHYPRIKLWVTDIAPREAKDTLSSNLVSAYKLYVDKYNISRRRANKEITKQEADAKHKPINAEIDRYRKDSLSIEENAYLDFVEHQCAASFLRVLK